MTKNVLSRITAALLAVILCTACFSIEAFAKDKADVRQTNVMLPDVSVEVEGKYSDSDIAGVTLDGESLSIKEVVSAKDAEGKLVYILVDISTSMSQQALNAVKPSLIEFATSLGKDDKLILMTFGTKVTKVLKGGESDKIVKEKINALKCNSQGTTFYKALTKALDDSLGKKDYDRKYAIVVSDGADFEKGNSSQEEVVDDLETNRLPIYGLCLESTSTANANGFGYISRESGGELVKFSSANAGSRFGKLKGIINDVTIIKAASKKRKSAGKKEIEIEFADGVGKTAKETVLVSAKRDDDKPTIDDISYDKDTNSFVVQFSEDVDGAEDNASYVIKKGDADSDNELAIVSVAYDSDDTTATITMDKTVYSGEYTIEPKGITDSTDAQNKMQKKAYTEKVKATPIAVLILKIVGIVLIPIAFLVAIYLILLNIKKKKHVDKIKDIFITQVEEQQHEHVHIVQQPQAGRKLKISIDAGNGQFHTVEFTLVKSMIVGRSTMSDLTIDDTSMSRQHFAVEDVETGLAVTDLGTTNGTFVNGVQIKSRTFLDSGAKIYAGNSVITIYY